MTELPPLIRDQRKADRDHLRLVAIFHFVFVGLSVLGMGFLALHYLLMHTVLANPKMWNNQKGGGPPPQEVWAILKWFYLIAGVMLVTCLAANLVSGWCLLKRKWRTLSLIVAAFNCLQFPFGTVLGVFTFVVLLRASVRELYQAGAGSDCPSPPPAAA